MTVRVLPGLPSAARLLILLVAMASSAMAAMHAVHLDLVQAVDGRDCRVHLGVIDGAVQAGFCSGWNTFPTPVTVESLHRQGDAWCATLAWEQQPDPWLPKDGEPVPCRFTVTATVAPDGTFAGTYDGTWREQASRGAVRGTLGPALAPRDGRLDARIFQAFYRLSPAAGVGGPNTDYALDMRLLGDLVDGTTQVADLESVVPDYRGYSARVIACRTEVDGFTLRATVAAELDTGAQGSERLTAAGVARREHYRYELALTVVGEELGGRCRIEAPGHSATVPVWGHFDRSLPPPLAGARAWLRLHRAMRDEWPVLLDLALPRGDGPVHGIAWAPRYNHQPQRLEASALRLDGERLHGALIVHVAPDCYHDQDVRFDLHYDIDCTVARHAVRGQFNGRDGALETTGAITGRLRARAAPAVTRRSLRAVRLDFGVALAGVHGKAARLTVELDCDAAQVTGGRVYAGPDGAATPIDAATLLLTGGRLTGTVAFALPEDAPAAGNYRYELDAVTDGARAAGLWRGTRDGTPILTKSAKLHARLTPTDAYDDRVLVLGEALPGGRDLHLHARRGPAGTTAFGLGPAYNRMVYPATLTQATWTQTGLQAAVDLTVPSDGWVPKGGRTLPGKLRLEDGRYTGSIDGTAVAGPLTGRVTQRSWEQARTRLALQLDAGARRADEAPRRLVLHLGFLDGRCVGGRAAPAGSITDTAFATRLITHAVELADGRLRGELCFVLYPQGAMDAARVHRVQVDVPVIGGHGGGTARVAAGDEAIASSPARVRIADDLPESARDARYVLALPGVFPDGNYLLLQLVVRDGVARGAILTAPNWNNAIHRVDTLALRVEDDHLCGEVAFTLLPDPWRPEDRQPCRGTLSIDAAVRAGVVVGRAHGALQATPFAAAVEGEAHAVCEPTAPQHLTLKLEDALTGGKAWHNRVFLGMDLAQHRITGGRASNNHTELAGSVDAGTWQLRDEAFSAQVSFTITAGGGADAGAYRATLSGVRVGDLLAGSYTCTRADGAAKRGSFWGGLR